MQDHNKLHVWQRAHALTLALHPASKRLTHRNAPGLRAQLLRAAVSIPSNIAEGAGQDSPAQFARFLTIAIASANELESHLKLARELALIDPAEAVSLMDELVGVRKMLFGLRRRVQSSPVTGDAVRSTQD